MLLFLPGAVISAVHAVELVWSAPVEVVTDVPASKPDAPWFQVFDVRYRHSLYKTDVSGPGANRAFRTERLFNEQRIDLRTARSWMSDDASWLWTTDVGTRRSDDGQITAAHLHDWQLMNLKTTLARDAGPMDWEASFGNVLPYYHNYAFSSSLEGLQGKVTFARPGGATLEFGGASGRTARALEPSRYQRWGNAAYVDLKSPDRWLGLLERSSMRLVGGAVHDDQSSIDAALTPVDARAVAVAAEAKFTGGLTWNVDWGLATGQQNVRLASRSQTGGAFQTRLNWIRPTTLAPRSWPAMLALPGSFRGSYEVIGDDYFAPQASAGVDVKRWNISSSHPGLGWLFGDWNISRTEDNAREKRSHTNYSLAQSYGMTLDPFRSPLGSRIGLGGDDGIAAFFEPRNLRMTFSFRHIGRHKTDFTVNTKTEDYGIGLGHKIGSWSLGGRFNWGFVDNEINAANDRRDENWAASLSRSFNVTPLGITIAASAGYRDGYTTLRNFRETTLTEGPNASFSVSRRELSGNASWSLSRRTQFRNGVRSSSRTHNGQAGLSWRPARFAGLAVNLSGSLTDAEESESSRNYRSRGWRGDVSYDF